MLFIYFLFNNDLSSNFNYYLYMHVKCLREMRLICVVYKQIVLLLSALSL